MTDRLRVESGRLVLWTVLIFLAVNAFSWSPGYGGRNDRQPGREVERYFGWPACFYCDLWRSDHDHQIALAAYFPPIPLTLEMGYVYSSWSLLGLVINVCVAGGLLGVCLLLIRMDEQGANSWLIGATCLLAGMSGVLILFGEEFSAYL